MMSKLNKRGYNQYQKGTSILQAKVPRSKLLKVSLKASEVISIITVIKSAMDSLKLESSHQAPNHHQHLQNSQNPSYVSS